jgi:hypothetical protein
LALNSRELSLKTIIIFKRHFKMPFKMLKNISVRRQVQEKQSADTENPKLQMHQIS